MPVHCALECNYCYCLPFKLTDLVWPFAQKAVGHYLLWYHLRIVKLALGFAGSKWLLSLELFLRPLTKCTLAL